MVMASGRWLGVRLDLLISLLIGAVALAAVLVSQDPGRYRQSEQISVLSIVLLPSTRKILHQSYYTKPYDNITEPLIQL